MDADLYKGKLVVVSFRRLGCDLLLVDPSPSKKFWNAVPPVAQTSVITGRRDSFMVAVLSIARLGNCRFGEVLLVVDILSTSTASYRQYSRLAIDGTGPVCSTRQCGLESTVLLSVFVVAKGGSEGKLSVR